MYEVYVFTVEEIQSQYRVKPGVHIQSKYLPNNLLFYFNLVYIIIIYIRVYIKVESLMIRV